MMRAFICIPHQRRLNGKAHVAAACGLRAFTFKLKKKEENTKSTTCVGQARGTPSSQPAQATATPSNTFRQLHSNILIICLRTQNAVAFDDLTLIPRNTRSAKINKWRNDVLLYVITCAHTCQRLCMSHIHVCCHHYNKYLMHLQVRA